MLLLRKDKLLGSLRIAPIREQQSVSRNSSKAGGFEQDRQSRAALLPLLNTQVSLFSLPPVFE